MPARVLIVEESEAGRQILENKLRAEYYDVAGAEDGPAALDAITTHEPDLILLDTALAGMDGFEVCRRIKRNAETAYIPVVMVSDQAGRDDKVRGLEAGADEFLTKPVVDVTLFARLRSLVRFKQTLDQWRLRGETTEEMGLPSGEVLAPPDDGRTARITLVDDHADQGVLVSEALDKDHDQVSHIGTFNDALNRVILSEPDVLLVGLKDVGDEPLRLCSSLRSLEQTRQMPLLLIGEEADSETLIKALELGVNDYTLRPVDEDELRARVRNLVRRKRYQDRLRTAFLQSLSLALTDSLTGLHNRRYFSTHLDSVFRRTIDADNPLALLMIDIDHFKTVNDTYGHAVGDEVLCEVARHIARNVRAFDLVARYGGEEFVVVMPDTDPSVARSVADRLRQRIAEAPIVVADQAAAIEVTVSVGISFARGRADDPDDLLKRADKALYVAKGTGRNLVITEDGEPVHLALAAETG